MSENKTKLEEKIRTEPVSWDKDLVYQKDGVVSKTLTDQKTGTITVFAFDEGQGLSEHSAPFDAFVHILDGEMEITIGGKPNKVNKDQSIIMPADIPHGLKALKASKMLLVMIRN